MGTQTGQLENPSGSSNREGDGSKKKMPGRKSGGGATGGAGAGGGAGGGANAKLVQTAERLMLDWQHTKESMQLGDGVRTVMVKHLTPIQTRLSAVLKADNIALFVQDWKAGDPDTKGRILLNQCREQNLQTN